MPCVSICKTFFVFYQGWQLGGMGAFGWVGGGNPSCPIDLLYSLSSIIQSLYGYGYRQTPSYTLNVKMTDPWGRTFPSVHNSYSSFGYSGGRPPFSGFLTVPTGPTNQFNPTCPWNLIQEMIAQIQEYVKQVQAVEESGLNTGGRIIVGSPGMRHVGILTKEK